MMMMMMHELISCIDNIDIADGNSGDDDDDDIDIADGNSSDDDDRDDDIDRDDGIDNTSLQASLPSTTLLKSMPP
jgi:hypothetical protein